MSTVRPWIVRKLRDNGWNDGALQLVGAHGLRVVRRSRPDALLYCAGARRRTFDAEDLDQAVEDLPGVQFVTVVPTHIHVAAEIRAVEAGVCVGGFAELGSALYEDDDVSQHLTREQKYVLQRLNAPRVVRSVRRTGSSSYEVERSRLRTVTIVSTDEYEITADEVYSLIEAYSVFEVDAIALANPNARGISSDAWDAGVVSGVQVLTLNDVLHALRDEWT